MNFAIFSFIEHPRMFYFFLCFSFFLGIIIGEYFSWGYIFFALFFLILLTIASFKKFSIKILALFASFIFGFGLIYNNHSEQNSIKNFLEEANFYNENIHVTGKIVRKMFQNDYRETHKLNIQRIKTEEKISHIQNKNIYIFVDIPKNLTLNADDTIAFSGKITKIYDEKPEIENFEKYSWLHNIYGKSSLYTFERLQSAEKIFFTESKAYIKKLIFNGFPTDISALILGVTIGDTDLLTSKIQDEFKNASLTHILVVSGSNIAFLILFLEFFLKYFPIGRIGKYFIIFSFIITYSHLVGWEIPVIRASMM